MTGNAVSLTLNEEERDLIYEILKERHRTLLHEIAHTDHYEFKAELQKKARLLESVLSRFMVRV